MMRLRPQLDRAARERGTMRIRKPSPGLVIAVVALVVGATGVATALPGKNKVRSDDIRNGVVNTKDLKNGGVGAVDVPNLKYTPLTLQNGYATNPVYGTGPPAYAVDQQGVVHLRGGATQASSAGGDVTTLPPAIRPDNLTVLATTCVTLGVIPASLIVNDDGGVTVTALAGENQNICENNGLVSFEGVTFTP
jgi:hypothetical protein